MTLHQSFLAALTKQVPSADEHVLTMITMLASDCSTTDELRDATEPFLDDLGIGDVDAFFDSLSLASTTTATTTTTTTTPQTSKENVPSSTDAKKVSRDLGPTTTSTSTKRSTRASSSSTTNSTASKRSAKAAASTSNSESTPSPSSTATPPVELVATSIQSRFHTDTLETLSNDVDLKGVNISINGLHLLQDAQLKLYQGVSYGLMYELLTSDVRSEVMSGVCFHHDENEE